MAGIYLPIRIEAIHAECDRSVYGNELLWRISLLDRVFLDEMSKKQKLSKKNS